MEIRYSIRPNKKNKTYLEQLTYGGVFRSLELAYRFALDISKAREFEVATYEVQCMGNDIVLMGKCLDKKILKRKELAPKEVA